MEVNFYIDLQDKIIVLLDNYHASHLFDVTRNIFCYDKKTGEEIWQVESKESSPYVEVGVDFPGLKEEEIKGEVIEKEGERIGIVLEQQFREGEDKLISRTFSCYKYYIDIESGKVECFGYTK